MLFSEREIAEFVVSSDFTGANERDVREALAGWVEHMQAGGYEVGTSGRPQPGAVSDDAMEAAREAFKQARQELEYFGASEDFTHSPLEAAISAYLDHQRGAVEPSERWTVVKMLSGTWNVRDEQTGEWVPDGVGLSKVDATRVADNLRGAVSDG